MNYFYPIDNISVSFRFLHLSLRVPIGAVSLLLVFYGPWAVSLLEAQVKQAWTPDLIRIAKADPVIETAIELITIPSPSGQESKVAELILRKLHGLGIPAARDTYGNVIAKVPASPGCESVPPILLTAHMDVVITDKKNPLKPIKPRIIKINGREWIASDGTTALGADDKAGVATIIDVIAQILGKHPKQRTPLKHGTIEVAFTREEETTNQGAIELDTTRFQSKYLLVLDGVRLYEVVWELASFTEVTILIHGARGGHSGEDIHRPDNINSIKVMSEIDVLVPQGVIKKNKRGVITSINAGLTEGGSAINVIASEAKIVYVVRSADAAAEKILLGEIRAIVSKIRHKYQALQDGFKIDLQIVQSLPPWSANTDSRLVKLVQTASEKQGGEKIRPMSIHAGAETNIYASKKNSKGETLDPLLLGMANLHAIHTTRERMEWRSLMTGRDWILQIIQLLAEEGLPH